MKRTIILWTTLILICFTLGACATKYEQSWTFDQTHHWHKSLDGKTITAKAPHTYGEWTTTTEPTHLQAGSKNRTCTTCGYVQTEALPVANVTSEQQLTEVLAQASDNDTVNVTGDIVFSSNFTVNKSVTIQGIDETTFSGRPLYVSSDVTVTFSNITFTNPDNSSETHANNNASSVYASKFNGKLTFDNCKFTNAPWDSMQITYEKTSTAEIIIKNCTFNNTERGYRYIHLQTTGEACPDVKVTMQNNTFVNISADYCQDSAITIYGITFDNITANGNVYKGDGATEEELTTAVIWISNGVDQTDLKAPTEIGSIQQ